MSSFILLERLVPKTQGLLFMLVGLNRLAMMFGMSWTYGLCSSKACLDIIKWLLLCVFVSRLRAAFD